MPGERYAWVSSQHGTHIRRGWTETVYYQTNSHPATKELVITKQISAKSRLGKVPSSSTLKIHEGEGESFCMGESMQPEVHFLKGKSPLLNLPPNILES